MELTLRQTSASGFLLPVRFTQAFDLVAKLAPEGPRGVMHGQELRIARALALADDAAVGFVLDFAGQGQRVEATGHGPSATLLAWALHAIAATLKCDLVVDGNATTPVIGTQRTAALAYLDAYEADVLASRKARGELDGDAFVAWLVREEHVALAESTSFAGLPMDDAARVYDELIESDAVDDVFVSERELARLLARFKARAVAA